MKLGIDNVKLRINATSLEAYNLYLTTDFMTKEKLHASIKGEVEVNRNMQIRSVCHRLIKKSNDALVDFNPLGQKLTYDCMGISLSSRLVYYLLGFSQGFGPNKFKEIKSVFLMTEMQGPVQIVCMPDAVEGSTISQFKFTTSTVDFDRYDASYQSRLYLYLFEADRINYTIFHLNDSNNVVDYFHKWELTMYRYPELENDCMNFISDFIRYVKDHKLEEYLQPKGEKQ